MAHGKIVCKECSKIITQCRCMEGHRNITYQLCEECKKTKENKDD